MNRLDQTAVQRLDTPHRRRRRGVLALPNINEQVRIRIRAGITDRFIPTQRGDVLVVKLEPFLGFPR